MTNLKTEHSGIASRIDVLDRLERSHEGLGAGGREVFALELDFDNVARARERGWHGLGQALKSFRDSAVSFPPYAPGARSAALDKLGPLELPGSGNRSKTGRSD